MSRNIGIRCECEARAKQLETNPGPVIGLEHFATLVREYSKNLESFETYVNMAKDKNQKPDLRDLFETKKYKLLILVNSELFACHHNDVGKICARYAKEFRDLGEEF